MEVFLDKETVLTVELTREDLFRLLGGKVHEKLIDNMEVADDIRIRLYCSDSAEQEEGCSCKCC